jgi:hypothetical protein
VSSTLPLPLLPLPLRPWERPHTLALALTINLNLTPSFALPPPLLPPPPTPPPHLLNLHPALLTPMVSSTLRGGLSLHPRCPYRLRHSTQNTQPQIVPPILRLEHPPLGRHRAIQPHAPSPPPHLLLPLPTLCPRRRILSPPTLTTILLSPIHALSDLPPNLLHTPTRNAELNPPHTVKLLLLPLPLHLEVVWPLLAPAYRGLVEEMMGI